MQMLGNKGSDQFNVRLVVCTVKNMSHLGQQ